MDLTEGLEASYMKDILTAINKAFKGVQTSAKAGTICVDEHKECEPWARMGECIANPRYECCGLQLSVNVSGLISPWISFRYMLYKCRRTCNTCISEDDDTSPALECPPALLAHKGDGMCDPELNVPHCDFDGGDCCEDQCQPGGLYECGSSGYDCFAPAPSNSTLRLLLDVAAALDERELRNPTLVSVRSASVKEAVRRDPELEYYMQWRRRDLLRIEHQLKAAKTTEAEFVETVDRDETRASMVEQMLNTEMILILDWSMGVNQTTLELPVMTPYRSGTLGLTQMPPAPADF